MKLAANGPKFRSAYLFASTIKLYQLIASYCNQLNVNNYSQTKFVAIILVLLVFNAIFRLTDFSSDPFDFSSLKTE